MLRSFFFFLSFCLLASLPAFAQTAVQTSAKQAIVIDYDTGTILFEKNARERMPTSSMSKVMSMYLVFEALKSGEIGLNDTFKVSEQAWRMQGSKMFVELGKDIPIEDLIRGVIVQSGNDATVVLAEGLAGSEGAFASRLTRKAQELGMNDSNFVNASGWPDPSHYSTAYDLSLLTASLIRNFPEYYKYYSEQEYTYHGIRQSNRNPLIYRNIGADGVKTGHTELGGYGLIGSGIRDGRRIILVVNGLQDEAARAQESATLLEWGLREFENRVLFAANTPILSIPVVLGQDNAVDAGMKEEVRATIPRGNLRDIKITTKFREPLPAPVTKGQEVGSLQILVPGQPPITRPLYALSDIPTLGFFKKTLAKARLYFSD
ncbi:MAG: D-alanyl-D-alanine carboxypeptidase [Alphaproteobacteria bacterium]|nr:D-alanyl-D-alanine carboxypeptidase [Alphaproteobacteria bacterium]